MQNGERWLRRGALLTGAASLLHVGIIFGGPDWYRFFGAGERMARLCARGSVYPTVITAGIASILGLWALYGLSGAGVIRRLPLLRPALVLIAGVYLARGALGIPLVLFVDGPYTDELKGRMTFMAVSSLLCIFLGLCYGFGAGVAAARVNILIPPAPPLRVSLWDAKPERQPQARSLTLDNRRSVP